MLLKLYPADTWERSRSTIPVQSCKNDDSDEQQAHASAAADLEQFLASVEQAAYRLVLAACQDPDEAVDLLQDAMTQLVIRHRHYDAGQWAALFDRIVQNRIRDWHHRRKVKNTLLRWTGLGDVTEKTLEIETDVRHHPDALLDSKNNLAIINNAVARLPLRQRQVFLLRAWQELSVNETACAMSISAGSVKTHYSRALGRLRELLDNTRSNMTCSSY